MLKMLSRRNALAALVLAVTTLVLAAGAVLSPTNAKDLPSRKLNGTYSASSIYTSCIDNSGTFFTGPNGSYGCAGGGGTVTCTKKGSCTGTCPKCAPSAAPKGVGGPGGAVSGTAQSRHVDKAKPISGASHHAPIGKLASRASHHTR
jgi:hypothetical protein